MGGRVAAFRSRQCSRAHGPWRKTQGEKRLEASLPQLSDSPTREVQTSLLRARKAVRAEGFVVHNRLTTRPFWMNAMARKIASVITIIDCTTVKLLSEETIVAVYSTERVSPRR